MPSLSGGGPKRLGSDFSLYLGEHNKVTIVLMEESIMYPYKGNIVVLGKDSLDRLPVRGLRFFVNILKFRKLVKQLNPHIVLSFQEPPSFLNVIVRHSFLKKRYQSIVSVVLAMSYGELETQPLERIITRFFVKFLYKMADVLVACSQGVKEDLINNYGIKPDQITVIYNPVNTKRARVASKEKIDHPWFSEDIPIIVNVGRLAIQKNQADLLRAFALVRQERDCRLVLIGEGPLREDLTVLAQNLGIIGDTLFLGFQENPFKYMTKSTLFAFSSIYEGFSLAVIEAMAVGCPVVSTDCIAGPREVLAPDLAHNYQINIVVEGKYGLLVPVNNIDALAEGIIRLIKNKDMREKYSQAGITRAYDFDIPQIVKKYINDVLPVRH
jgi:glycosyltransferase involved in cell wall biosynthesis